MGGDARLGIAVPEGDWNTVAGLTMGVAGRVLSPGDQVEIDDHWLVVLNTQRRRMTRIQIELVPHPATGSE